MGLEYYNLAKMYLDGREGDEVLFRQDYGHVCAGQRAFVVRKVADHPNHYDVRLVGGQFQANVPGNVLQKIPTKRDVINDFFQSDDEV